MNKTITIKGTGKVSAKPDYVGVSLQLETKELKYDDTMDKSAAMLEELRKAVGDAGFDRKDLKTVSFNVNADYENVHDQGGFRRVFKGFLCRHNLKLEFDLDMKRLSKLFAMLAKCTSDPQFSVCFTVKNKDALKQEMLENAAKDAKEKAVILAQASGIKLGELIAIDYSCKEVKFQSATNYRTSLMLADAAPARSIDIEPDDITEEDNVTFVWSI